MDNIIKIISPSIDYSNLKKGLKVPFQNEAVFNNLSIKTLKLFHKKFRLLKFDYCVFENVVFDSCDLNKFEAINCVFKNCDFANTIFEESIFSKVEFISCRFTGSQLPESILSDFLIENCQNSFFTARYTNFKNGILIDNNFNSSDFTSSSFINIDFDDCNLKESNFSNCNFTNVDISKSNIDKATFSKDKLSNLTISYEQSYIFAKLLGLRIV
jgi:uncharacterized protein YjbI with pentapeptide repeats